MTMIPCDLHKKLIGPRKYYWFFPFFYKKKERNGKNELKEARKILNNVSSGSSFNSLRPSSNVKLFIRRVKYSELSSWKVRRLPKLTSSAEWVWIIQHVLSALHWKTSPVKSGVFIRLCEEKRGFKGYRRFRTLMKFIASSNCQTFKREYRKKRSRLALF